MTNNHLHFSDTNALQFAGKILVQRDGRFVEFDMQEWLRDNAPALRDAEASGAKLTVDILASASGILINNRVYKGKDWKKAAKKFKDRPILKHHDTHTDAIGRINKGRFEQKLKGDAFNKDYLKPATQDHGTESGLVWVNADITDAEAIQMILDRRLLHTSQGSRAKSAKCSICGNDWVHDYCEHRPGQMYKTGEDGKGPSKMCFWQVDGLSPRELSFVNEPAFGKSQVIKPEDAEDADEAYLDMLDSVQDIVTPQLGTEVQQIHLVDAAGNKTDVQFRPSENIEIFTVTGNPENDDTDTEGANNSSANRDNVSDKEPAMEADIKELKDELEQLKKDKKVLEDANESLKGEKEELEADLKDTTETLEALQEQHNELLDTVQEELVDRYVKVASIPEDKLEDAKSRLKNASLDNIRFMIDEAERIQAEKETQIDDETGIEPATEGGKGDASVNDETDEGNDEEEGEEDEESDYSPRASILRE